MDLMIDLETLGTNHDAPVISIGAVKFSSKGLGEEFYVNLDVEEQIKDGRQVTGSTIKWWMGQEGAARKVFKEKSIPTAEGLLDFVEFFHQGGNEKSVFPWGNGATFDITILEHLLNQCLL